MIHTYEALRATRLHVRIALLALPENLWRYTMHYTRVCPTTLCLPSRITVHFVHELRQLAINSTGKDHFSCK